MPKALAVLLFALPLFAEPQLVLRMRDGSQVELKQSPPHGHIVEFREAPLAARGPRALASYPETFARFRRDLGDARSGGPAASAEQRITHEFYRLFYGVSVALDESEVARIRALPYVKAVYVDEPVQAFAAEDTTRIARIGADRVWSEWKTRGAGVIVAVIDTGIDATHPSLAGKVIGGYDLVDEDDDPSDEEGHGTHVAGIIAGEGSGVQGVAPDVKLLSYRVLNARGVGTSADIIAALEWAADPDRDNDFSDHADVANLSLGSRNGSADSPTSIAADHAVEAGVVVCLAAGNAPGGKTIGSPAASRLAITVGASDADDRITFWSSRGPAFPDLALKPEISAPGNEIVSAQLGGGTTVKSGTSMAAPHVSGAAALLLALHPEWSPAQVKAALIASADDVSEEVMARGGGRLNVYKAAGSAIAIEPSALSFGNGTAGAWSRSRTVRVTNREAAARTFTATSTAPDGVTMSAEPSTFTLDAGASRDVVLTVTVAANATPPASTRSHGGLVSFRTEGAAAQLPWVAIGAARLYLDYAAPDSEVAITWRCSDGSSTFPRYDGGTRWVTLLPYGRCGVTVGAIVQSGAHRNEVGVLLETHDITGDTALQRSPADSVHVIEPAGVDAEGALIRPTDLMTTPYFTSYNLDLPPGSLYALDSAIVFDSFPLRINTVPDATVTASQVLFDFPRHRVIAVNFEPIHGGIHSDVTLHSLPTDLKHVRVNVAPQNRRFELQSTFTFFSNGQSSSWTGGGAIPLQDGWRGDLYLTPATNPDAWAAPAFGTGWLRLPDPETDLQSDAIRWVDGRFVVSNDTAPPATAYSVGPGETLHLGQSPLYARSLVLANDAGFTISYTFFAAAGERKDTATRGFRYELRDASGALLGEGTTNVPYIGANVPRGAYRATVRAGGTELALSFNSTRTGFDPPVLTSLRILDGEGALATAVAPGEHATLAFTAEDVHASRGWWRTDGDWQPLAIPGSLPTNVFGPVDLRIELEDAGGNTAATTIEDAYSVGAKRRAMRR